ncbi:long-chain-fatty-acid--CoA ligase 3 [Trichonephila inaurata madagascariensis]|uniref:long-chain-fatty-acid--CoA ligase n=1 Tax=Trichonephila inaurata madagascariensis TaxID=2747483 RepID=A0A8X6MDZ7_9ARAC|nr:long-chain-fatty-acid--CoA ligase 3 [Trichonephila inaurata madagascariensis]
MALQGWRAKIVVYCIKFLVLIYDILSFPIYFLIDKPWNRWKLQKIIWSKLEDDRDPYSCYVRQVHHKKPEENGVKTMDELFRSAVEKFGERECYGVREVLGEEVEETSSGKVFKKMNLGEYKWSRFNEINQRVDDVSKGLLSLGVRSKKPVILLAETRLEWIITAQACFRINVPVVTLYATLGEDGIIHGITETEVTHIITSSEIMPKLKKILHKVPMVSHLVYMEGKKDESLEDIPTSVKVVPFRQMEASGREYLEANFTPPKSDDLAILMYTSGSTGIPKGVMITHKNLITSVKGFNDVLSHPSFQFRERDTYIAYLPAAHVLELATECFLTYLGIRVGFSTPQTLTDFSTAVKKGEKGDLKVLKPTLMVVVPLMLDRIRKSIIQLAGKEGTFTRLMLDFAVSYKKFWSEKGFRTPRLDKKLLKTYKDFMGGELRVIMCGSAPLSPDTQAFIRSCLNVQVLQGYGLTETAACATIMDFDDYSSGRVGAPVSTCKLRLVNWKEGNYFVTDKPNPRGEVVIGGDCLTLGYFKNSVQTQEAFKIEGGDRWFYTGDIGEMMPDGTLKIIDRKKDLVKLQFGEYIALGKVEAELKTYPLIENICVFGNGLHTYLIALIIPNPMHLKSLAKELGKKNVSFEEMCSDEEVAAEAAQRIRDFGKRCGLVGSELPRKIKLCVEDWNPESGLVTAAFKLRRKNIENHYRSVIDSLYAESRQNGPSSI